MLALIFFLENSNLTRIKKYINNNKNGMVYGFWNLRHYVGWQFEGEKKKKKKRVMNMCGYEIVE